MRGRKREEERGSEREREGEHGGGKRMGEGRREGEGVREIGVIDRKRQKRWRGKKKEHEKEKGQHQLLGYLVDGSQDFRGGNFLYAISISITQKQSGETMICVGRYFMLTRNRYGSRKGVEN